MGRPDGVAFGIELFGQAPFEAGRHVVLRQISDRAAHVAGPAGALRDQRRHRSHAFFQPTGAGVAAQQTADQHTCAGGGNTFARPLQQEVVGQIELPRRGNRLKQQPGRRGPAVRDGGILEKLDGLRGAPKTDQQPPPRQDDHIPAQTTLYAVADVLIDRCILGPPGRQDIVGIQGCLVLAIIGQQRPQSKQRFGRSRVLRGGAAAFQRCPIGAHGGSVLAGAVVQSAQ